MTRICNNPDCPEYRQPQEVSLNRSTPRSYYIERHGLAPDEGPGERLNYPGGRFNCLNYLGFGFGDADESDVCRTCGNDLEEAYYLPCKYCGEFFALKDLDTSPDMRKCCSTCADVLWEAVVSK